MPNASAGKMMVARQPCMKGLPARQANLAEIDADDGT